MALAALLIVLPNWPGRINNDTVGMLQQIDRHRISNWHSPLLQYLYLPVRELGGGIAPAFVVTFLVGFAGLLLIFENFGISRLKSSLLALGVCLFPVTYGLLSSVTRDAWFMALWLLALGITRTHRIRGARRFGVLFAVLFFVYSARQNGIVIALPLFAAALWDPAWAATRRWRWWLKGLAAAGASAAIVLVMSLVLMLLPIRKENPEAVTYLFDLIRLSVRNDEMLLPPELNPFDLSVDFLKENTTAVRLDDVVYRRDRMHVRLDDPEAQLARDTWLDFVTDDPVEYLRMRWQMMTYQIGLGGNTRNTFIGGMIDNPYGIQPAFPGAFAAATDYQLSFGGGSSGEAGVVHRVWPVLLLSVVAVGAALTRRRGAPYAVDAFVSSVLVMALLFFVAPQVHFRYMSPIYVVLGIACLGLTWPWRDQRTARDDEAEDDFGAVPAELESERSLTDAG